jgi:hypothetical protein
MFPWYSTWAPTVHWPFSGAVKQTIAPETDWFFGRIALGGGDEDIEQRVFEEVASYGKQLGLISEILVEMADNVKLSKKNAESLARLKEIASRVEGIKDQQRDQQRHRLKDALLALRDSDKEGYKEILDAVKWK